LPQLHSKSKLLNGMSTGDPPLVDLIREEIQRDGPVTFRWFMEQALYHPAHGYYSSGRCAIGRRGDYFTNVSVGSIFGRLLAAQFAEMWEQLGRPDGFVILEEGAHDGAFACDVLQAVSVHMPELFEALEYRIVEPHAKLRERQGRSLDGFTEKISWSDSLAQLEPFCGVHFSNELFDAMPVHIVRLGGDGPWSERYVVQAGDGFALVDGAISTQRLQEHLQTLPPIRAMPYETEVNLAGPDLINAIAEKLTRGFILTVDYGHARADYYTDERCSGTLRCVKDHRVLPSPLLEVGHADITAHVDWTSIAERAQQCGLRVTGFTDQHHFLTGVVSELFASEFGSAVDTSARRSLQTLLNPTMLGRTFQVLELAQNISFNLPRSGFKFARDPERELFRDSPGVTAEFF